MKAFEEHRGDRVMNDAEIVDLYLKRSERAIAETQTKYGAYCTSIARNILGDAQEAEESAADTYLAAWNSIPPHRPAVLRTYLGKLARRISLKKWRDRHALRRGRGEVALVLDELAECVSDGRNLDDEMEMRMLARSIDRFLAGLRDAERRIFICRYWYMDPIADIGRRFGYSQSKVKSLLFRLRHRLKEHLESEGYLQ